MSYYDRVIKAENNAKHFIIRVFGNAKQYGWSSEQINKEVLDYKSRAKIGSYPRYVSSYISGCFDMMTALAYSNELEYCYMIGDKKYSIRKESDMHYTKHGITSQDLCEKSSYSGYYWIATGEIYFGGEVKR